MIVIAAGGTGGHLFPAQALASLLEKEIGSPVVFMGKALSRNSYFDHTKFQSIDIESAHMGLKALFAIPYGVFQSLKVLFRNRPKVVVGFGSYHSFPVLVAALMLGIPIILHEANCKAGKVNRLLSRFALFSGVFFSHTKLSGCVIQADLPLRANLQKPPSKEQALSYYGLQPDKKTILVFGGSQGAKRLNELTSKSIAALKSPEKIQVVHFTGTHEMANEMKVQYASAGIPHVVKEFESAMENAWQIADLVISRAGASTIAEQIAFSVPAILIPYPHATDQHQNYNAKYVQEVVGGALVLFEKQLNAQILQNEIEAHLDDKRQKIIRDSINKYKMTKVSSSFVRNIIEYVGKK